VTLKRRRKIRKSREIVLGVAMLSLVATVTAGCEDRRCVDSTGRVVSEEQCHNEEARPYYGGGSHMFFWYYGGTGGYAPGSIAGGGTFSTPRSSSWGGRFSESARSFGGSVSRGGFGGGAFAHGGGGG